jgi:hypothetical protein
MMSSGAVLAVIKGKVGCNTAGSRFRTLVLAACLGAVAGSSGVDAKIYKWTDESGQVHFSNTPPGSKTQGTEVVDDGQSSRHGADQPNKVIGAWYRLQDGRQHLLYIDHDRFRYRVWERSVHPRLRMSGFWEYDPPHLNLEVLTFQGDNDREPETRRYRVYELSPHQLTMEAPDGEVQRSVRRQPWDITDITALRLKGTWQQHDGPVVLAMEDGVFDLFLGDGNAKRPDYRGNWFLDEQTLTLHYTGGSRQVDRIGQRWVYQIERFDNRQLWLRLPGDREMLRLERRAGLR